MSNTNYIVSARKYRPATFDTVVGQRALTHTLKTAIAAGRLAHAYLFCGPRGVGKTTCARIFAKTINCTNPTPEGEACNECESCRAFNEQRSFNIIEMDAASNNGVDAMRELTGQVLIPPQTGRYKVYIIDEVHMLSTAAFNAFLKTLEEPPEYAIFIMATTEKQKVIPTILSRCQIYDFARITVPDIVEQLQRIAAAENIAAEPAALNVIAQKADGAMRDALSIFDQVAASSQGNITYRSAIDNLNVLDYDYYFRLVETMLTGDVTQALLIYKEIRDRGFDSQFFVNGLARHIRDLMMAATPQTTSLLEMNQDVAQRYAEQAGRLGPRFFYTALDLLNTCDLNYRNASSKLLLVELTLIKLCQIVNPVQAPTTTATPVQKIQQPAPQQPAPQQPHQQAPQPPVQQQAPQQPVQRQVPQPPADTIPHIPGVPARKSTADVPDIPGVPKPKPQPSAHEPASQPQAPQPAPQPEPEPEPKPAGDQPFTAEQLQQAWRDFIADNPQEQILITTMRMAIPTPIDDTRYQVAFEGQGQVETFNAHQAKLLEYLRKRVSNNNLAINVIITETPSAPRRLSPREVVEQMKQRNPEFNQMLVDYQLGLA